MRETIDKTWAGFTRRLAALRPARANRPPVMVAAAEETGSGGLLVKLVLAAAALLLVVLLFQADASSAAVPVLMVLALAAFVGYEIRRRRNWEKRMAAKLQSLAEDDVRVMRDVARQRQDLLFMREALAGAGAAMRRQQDKTEALSTAEQRMLHTISGVLAGLTESASRGVEDDDALPVSGALDLAIIEHHAQSGAENPSLSDAQVVQLVRAAVDQDRIDLFTQPIVTLPQRKPRFIEAFSRIRIRKDVYMPAERYVAAARQNALLPAIDNLLLLRSLQALRQAVENDPACIFFCNVTSLTLHDPKFMTDLVEFIAQHRELAPRLVFELSQHDLETLRHDILPVLAGLSHLGCRFSMDQVRALNISAEGLSARFVRFVKIDATLLLEALRQINGRERLQQMKAALDLEGIDIIVEKVESEKQLVELLDLGIDYGQGYLFGQPAAHGAEAAA